MRIHNRFRRTPVIVAPDDTKECSAAVAALVAELSSEMEEMIRESNDNSEQYQARRQR
jgi:hypothetical protein